MNRSVVIALPEDEILVQSGAEIVSSHVPGFVSYLNPFSAFPSLAGKEATQHGAIVLHLHILAVDSSAIL
jgi:hypothetical protein